MILHTTTTLPVSSHSTSSIIISPSTSSPSTSPIHVSFTEDSMYSSSDYDCDITELNFNFIIRSCNEKARPANDADFETSQFSDQRKVPKSSSNVVPKESNIDEENSKKAAIVMELTKKWFCQEYSRTCFIDTIRHIQLTLHHLTS
ncbi:hypothetical protein RclHR1_18130003 [Rhizophagus clarus]|uniref:Uncharacterized protein n=1 Tax=Rhizophagus clarus TaxID=94130 RepID=A0A2Z6QZ35_9GLOM|nr:hypothetical protein RclHR1_18130003 [Rhizophagus clarus]